VFSGRRDSGDDKVFQTELVHRKRDFVEHGRYRSGTLDPLDDGIRESKLLHARFPAVARKW
jgi:hypothetical protein